jgi:hypothetical protein
VSENVTRENELAVRLEEAIKRAIEDGWRLRVTHTPLAAKPVVLHEITLTPPYPSEQYNYHAYLLTGENK